MIKLKFLFFMICSSVVLQAQINRSEMPKITPDSVAFLLENNMDSNLVIFNTGPVDDIKNAINIGAVEEKNNLKKLKKILRKLPKDKHIIYYCGCCPFATCPNLMPAHELLSKMKFTNFQAIDLPEALKIDWINKGYPMKEAQ